MAQGMVPQAAVVELPPGLWKAPRWAGIETIPALILIMTELAPILMKSLWLFIVVTVFLAFWWPILTIMFRRDERAVAIMLKTRHFHSLEYLRGDALASTPYERLNRAV